MTSDVRPYTAARDSDLDMALKVVLRAAEGIVHDFPLKDDPERSPLEGRLSPGGFLRRLLIGEMLRRVDARVGCRAPSRGIGRGLAVRPDEHAALAERHALDIDQLGNQLVELVAGEVELAGQRAHGKAPLLFEDLPGALELGDEAQSAGARRPITCEGPPPEIRGGRRWRARVRRRSG